MKRAIGLLTLYVLALSLVSLAGIFHVADMWLVGRSGLLGEAPALPEHVVIINVPFTSAQSPQHDRQSIAALLLRLAEAQPHGIVLDIDVSYDDRGLDVLTDAVRRVREKNVEFYAAANPDCNGDGSDLDDYLTKKADFYREIDGHGHTCIDSQSGVLWYRARMESANGTVINALPILVGETIGGSRFEQAPTLIIVGDEAERDRHTWDFVPGAAPGTEFHPRARTNGIVPKLNGKTIIVGTLDKRYDYNSRTDRFGLDLVAWAISDRITRDQSRPRLVEGTAWAVGMTLVMSLVATGVSRGLFRWLPSQRSRLWLLSALSVLTSVLIFAGIVLVFKAAGVLYPQWTLVVAGILIAVGLTGYALHCQLLIAALKLDMENTERVAADQYDVFISYSRTPENLKWVSENVYPALAAARRPDGSPLRVFFDKRSIFLGASWYEKIAQAIQGSRYFVPVYSEDYFRKGFCRFEIELAAIKRVQQQDFILPLARLTTGVPPGYQHINFIPVSERPDFVDVVLATVNPSPKPA